jgi:hypothetical protein
VTTLSRNRVRRTLTVVGLCVWGLLALAGPALATSSGDDGEAVTEPLSKAHVLLVYVGLPLAIVAVIWLLASIPSMLSAPRYRPGLSWWASPVWFSGPAEDVDGSADGGSSDEAVGGTSARW